MTDGNPPEPAEADAPGARSGWPWLCIVLLAPIIIDVIDRSARSASSLLVHGLRDEAGHLLTAYVCASGLIALRMPLTLTVVLLGGVLIDMDHILQLSGAIDAVPGSSRPGSHSLAIPIIALIVATIDRRRVWVWISFAVSFGTHLVRDMATGTVPLFWPLAADPVSITYDLYAVALLAFVGIALGKVVLRRLWRSTVKTA